MIQVEINIIIDDNYKTSLSVNILKREDSTEAEHMFAKDLEKGFVNEIKTILSDTFKIEEKIE